MYQHGIFEILTPIVVGLASFAMQWKFRGKWTYALPFMMAFLVMLILPEIYYAAHPYQGGGAGFYGFIAIMVAFISFFTSFIGILTAQFLFKPKSSNKFVP
jgi:uncharacterized membrane protein